MNNLEKAKANYYLIDKMLSKYATKSSESIKLCEEKDDLRTPFARDVDRIIHALSYTRYINKTQVYSFKKNDHISTRSVHVQFVSKIARTIGRSLCLNTDLIEAIALGHDIGHTPLGHFGESVLNEISQKELGEYFAHNIQSVREYMYIEKNGMGLNLSLQVLDGIMTHNGEILNPIYRPISKDKEEFLREYNEAYKDLNKSKKYAPMTLEGCVVRISDIIAYIGRDIEDAINLGLLKRSDIPKEITDVLGNNNKEIVNTIINDIINNSIDKEYIKLSDNVYKALFALKEYNYLNIYSKSMDENLKKYYKDGIEKLYEYYLEQVTNNETNTKIYEIFLNRQNKEYLNNTNDKRKVLDYIAGMTDEFLNNEIDKILKKY